MSDIKKAAQNSLVLSIGGILNRVFEIVSIILLVGYLSTDDFGRYAAIFVYVSFWALLIRLWHEFNPAKGVRPERQNCF